ncbi:hypothetical protein M409DRAFT_36898 [Zasmidium cellare ATCC 36951]|uniref:VOC domain-containing protein n=1 Tax=Zasmidium cellare ATCC 36951 TaxID=1080233 RepID=A0A6A6CE61_ZASCE|nr:uncharacterized protein M409DRAFT_36898 [Zasmidium cellare ATCC 36951]KAF2165395.1 hypothetical protein M409DRAFT_36898 [Zasmidium cellare ATCC 36951]
MAIAATKTVAFNKGASVQDTALAKHDLSQTEWRKAWGIDKNAQIRLVRLAFMQYQHPDLEVVKRFMLDFGMTPVKTTEQDVWFRGYGSDAYVYHARKGSKAFLGGAFVAETFQDLERYAMIKDDTPLLTNGIEKMDHAPGGGSIVTSTDPEGFPLSLVYGEDQREPDEMPPEILMNDEVRKPRQRKFQRFTAGPATVFRLGHYGLVVSDFERQSRFYASNFNLVPSTLLHVDIPATEGEPQRMYVAMFSHIDRGTELVDHHSFFLAQAAPGGETHVHHSSFEIHDLDSQMMGHDWLKKQGYRLVWGIGRHIAGSQIFDYWRDPNDFMVEHYIDGDIVNEDTPVSRDLASSAQDAAWGPEVPDDFTR